MPLSAPPTKPAVVSSTTSAASASSPKVAQAPGAFHISLYEPNYIMPAYYTFSPDESVYRGHTPHGERLRNVEFAYQISLQIPIVSNVANMPLSFDAAYTQKSYWQAYNKSAFFRESDYEPELFMQYRPKRYLPFGWSWTQGSLGVVHQSNGKGGELERSWNRVYVSATVSKNHWRVKVQPWYVIHDSMMEQQNPDIARYLGYGQWILSYRWSKQEISLLSRNNLTSGFSRGYWQMAWTFPLIQELKGYVQVSTGYGQSLIEYDHATTAVGLGIALNNW